MISFPNAKINLGLDIIEKRTDGFHNLSTCFYPIPLKDVIEYVESKKFDFQISGITLDDNSEDNLVIKAYRLLKRDFQLPEISIHLHKVIPPGAGLGGGSSDAAFMLSSLNSYFELFLDDALLAEYAEKLGSDCPFFIYNNPMLASGRGEILSSIHLNLKDKYICLIKPDFSISTKEAYTEVKPSIPVHSVQQILNELPPDEWKTVLKNDFEKPLFIKYPLLGEIKNMLYEKGAFYASMSGSGSAIYGIFETKPKLPEFTKGYFMWTGQL